MVLSDHLLVLNKYDDHLSVSQISVKQSKSQTVTTTRLGVTIFCTIAIAPSRVWESPGVVQDPKSQRICRICSPKPSRWMVGRLKLVSVWGPKIVGHVRIFALSFDAQDILTTCAQ